MKREDVRRQSMFWLNLHCFSNMISFLFFWKRLLPNYFIPIFNFIQKARIYHVRHNHLWSYAHSSPTPIRLHPERNSRIDRHLTFIVLSSGSGLPKANDGIFIKLCIFYKQNPVKLLLPLFPEEFMDSQKHYLQYLNSLCEIRYKSDTKRNRKRNVKCWSKK